MGDCVIAAGSATATPLKPAGSPAPIAAKDTAAAAPAKNQGLRPADTAQVTAQSKTSPAPLSLMSAAPTAQETPTVDLGKTKGDDKAPNPWRVKKWNLDYGLMFDVRYTKSDMHVQRPGQNSDFVIHNAAAHDRTSAHYLYSMPNGHPQPDEPQYSAAVGVTFNNNLGLELSVKHNKYVVMTGEDPDQQVRVTGTIGGEQVDEMRSMKSLFPTYQITNGLNQISIMATKAFEIGPTDRKSHLTYNVKAGPSVYMPWTKGEVGNPDGTVESFNGPYHFSGVGIVAEHSLRYEFRKVFSLELEHSMSAMHLPNSVIAGGKVSQSIAMNQFGLTLGHTFGVKPKKH